VSAPIQAVALGENSCVSVGPAGAIHLVEWDLVGALLLDPVAIPDALRHVQPGDLYDPRLRPVLATLQDMSRAGEPITPAGVAHELARRGELQAIGGPVTLGKLLDGVVTSAMVEPDSRRVLQASLERQLREAHAEAVRNPRDPDLYRRIRELYERLGVLHHGPAALASVGFSGDCLRALRERPQPSSPLPGLLDSEPHLHVLSGKTKTGKTTFVLAIARGWGQGISPWPGAPSLPGSRALVVSREQPVVRLDAVLRRLCVFADAGSIERMTDRVTLVGRDPDLDPQGRRLLRLDEEGRTVLRATLQQAKKESDPFGLTVLDSLSRLKPPDVEENDNDAMTAWLDAIEEIAVEFDVYILLIHHVGHSNDPGRSEARSAGRGASAIAACAQVLWLLERCPGNPHQRLLKVDGNVVLNSEHTFEVSGPDAEPGAINYFRPIDPLDEHDIDDLCAPGEKLNQTDLAWRVAGKEREPNKRPPGRATSTAASLMSRWSRDGLGEVFPGPRRSKIFRRFPATEPTEPDRAHDPGLGEGRRPSRARHKGARSGARS